MAEPLKVKTDLTVQEDAAKRDYLASLQLIERLHRRFLDVVKVELDSSGLKAVSNVQAMILYNVGNAEITVGELTSRGYYQGSNVSYNLKKLVDGGFLKQERSSYDRRSIRIRLTPAGRDLVQRIDTIFDRQVTALAGGKLGDGRLARLNRALMDLESFWSDEIRFLGR